LALIRILFGCSSDCLYARKGQYRIKLLYKGDNQKQIKIAFMRKLRAE
jgi:hypothetical protein